MGKSSRCKTSKNDHKHIDKTRKKALRSPASNKYSVPLNKIIDQNGKAAQYIHSKLIKQNKRNNTLRKPKLTVATKLKIDEFIFGASANKKQKEKLTKIDDDDCKCELEQQIATTHAKPERNVKSNDDDDSKNEIDNETNSKEQEQK